MTNYITYYRVSTVKQGSSGLGLEAQEETIKNFLSFNKGKVLQSFTEVESGAKDDRKELSKALEMCKQYNATLLIAKLDRLARKVSFISALMDSKINFIACDNPNANSLTVHILSAMAEHERELISKRTKEALGRVKANGKILGNPKNLKNQDIGRQRGTSSAKEKANIFASNTFKIIKPLLEQNYSYTKIASEFNDRGLLTARGLIGSWTARAVKNIVDRVS